MNSSTLTKITLSTLTIGLTMTACGPSAQTARPVAASNQMLMIKQAQSFADQAASILAGAKVKKAGAIDRAEKAVALMPNNVSYRMLLGRAYLANGRFSAAETSFNDVLTLDPNNGKAALNVALMQISRGDSAAALSLLSDHRDRLSLADYGLAQALAGDLTGGLETLQNAARAPDASAKSRQNLGFAYALAGRWMEARTLASQDLSPDLVDTRMTQWSNLTHPRAAWDQVAGLLGVTPVKDGGQPQYLALAKDQNPALAALAPQIAPVTSDTDAVSAAESPQARFETPVVVQAPEAAAPKIVKIALDEPAAVHAPLIKAEMRPTKQFIVPASLPTPSQQTAARPIKAGQFVIQLGAFSAAARAEIAWNRAVGKVAELGNYDPSRARIKVKSASLFRLSAGAFASRDAANQVCMRVRQSGGQCFVRTISGDTPMQFASRGSSGGGTKLTARR